MQQGPFSGQDTVSVLTQQPPGMAIIPAASVKEGDLLVADGGFTGLHSLQLCEVKKDPTDGELYVECAEGKHFLEGQLDWETFSKYVGFWHVPEEYVLNECASLRFGNCKGNTTDDVTTE